ncbi:hypothetical protein DFH08DRAFT_803496 [Mycena albidolilacea]|uniref:CxC2-like cysteine cluster KDZ transposase-associated domain-containing protein n=1 Tax=Mycena albidolilacea TaxID=1033008 RepID=A0AAD7EY27_9AGAR|nr:hypothetical protein DFH08DRAFT_803496 [Mycena albidolilacea]
MRQPRSHLTGLMKRSLTAAGPAKNKAKNVYSLKSFGHSLTAPNPTPPVAQADNLMSDGRHADIQNIALDSHSLGPSSPPRLLVDNDNDNWLDLESELNPGGATTTGTTKSCKRKWYVSTDDALQYWVTNFRDAYLQVLVSHEGHMGQDGVEWLLFLLMRAETAQATGPAWPSRQPALPFSSTYHWEQLLVYGWYPLTPDNPQSTITTPTLKLFYAVSLQGKTTVYYFFNALAKITDNTGGCAFKRHYQLVLRVICQWCNLHALKHGGIGNDPNRCTAETKEGELLRLTASLAPSLGLTFQRAGKRRRQSYSEIVALFALSCALIAFRLLYAIFLAIDTCFRLKRKKILSWHAEPSILDGWAYFTHSVEYLEFIKTLGEQKEGYAATGCNMITYARHEVVCKNGVADLQAEKKYSNMDYVVASTWQHFRALRFFLLSYDIMCQWSKNLRKRLLKLPPVLQFHLVQYIIKFVIPKLHILRHLKLCQDLFSLLFTLGAVQADMEGIEWIWSSSGLMGTSTHKMGLGSRQDTLDNFWHYWNWNKIVGMGTTLRNRFLRATKELARHKDALKEEEQQKERSSSATPTTSEATATEYLMLGLEIEGQQRQLAADMLANRSPTTKELTEFVTRYTRLSRQIKKLWLMQKQFSPGTLQRLATAAGTDAVEAERTLLLLPSALSTTESLPLLSAPRLAASKAWLRNAQCSESLDYIPHGLSMKKQLQTYKTLNLCCQCQNTRTCSLVDNQQRKVDLAAGTYRQAQAAHLALAHVTGSSAWRQLEKDEEAKKRKQQAMKAKQKEAAQINENGEVRGVPEMGEKSRLISWIWQSAGQTGGIVGADIRASIRVEWYKSYAWVKCWGEEVLFPQEEMKQCLLTLEWQATIWDQRAKPGHYTGTIVYSPIHWEGAMALAARQATLCSPESSGNKAGYGFNGGNGSDAESEADEDEPAARELSKWGEVAAKVGAEEESDTEGAKENVSQEETATRRAPMDKLLTIQSASIGQYNDM